MRNDNISADESQQTGVIYKITCLVNGKLYVGQTRQKLSRRITEHKRDSSKGSIGLGAAIRKYGWENFSVEVIEECPVDKLSEREIFWIAELNSRSPHGYNLTDGGEGLVNPSEETRAKMSAHRPDVSGEKNPRYGKKCSPETRAKISSANRGKPSPMKGKHPSEETRAKMSAHRPDISGEKNPRYGKKCSPETRAKISAANMGKPSPMKGKKHSEETRAKISAKAKGRTSPRKGKHLSEETKAKLSAAKKGKKGTPHSPEVRAKISAANKGKPSHQKGKPRSEETKAKISAAKKAWWARKKLENGGGK